MTVNWNMLIASCSENKFKIGLSKFHHPHAEHLQHFEMQLLSAMQNNIKLDFTNQTQSWNSLELSETKIKKHVKIVSDLHSNRVLNWVSCYCCWWWWWRWHDNRSAYIKTRGVCLSFLFFSVDEKVHTREHSTEHTKVERRRIMRFRWTKCLTMYWYWWQLHTRSFVLSRISRFNCEPLFSCFWILRLCKNLSHVCADAENIQNRIEITFCVINCIDDKSCHWRILMCIGARSHLLIIFWCFGMANTHTHTHASDLAHSHC